MIGSVTHKFMGGGGGTQTHSMVIVMSLLLFFQNEESRLKLRKNEKGNK
jgi:hypothetical protein